MTIAEWWAVLAVCLGATAQTITGIGFALVCAPLLILCLGALDGVTLVNILGALLSLFVLLRERKFLHFTYAVALFIPAIAMSPFARFLIHSSSPALLSVLSGLLVLIGVGLLSANLRSERFDSNGGMVTAGAISGFMGVVAGIAGPAVALYVTNAKSPVEMLRPTLNLYFIGVSAIAVLVRGLPSMQASFGIALSGAVIAGIIVGHLIAKRLHANLVRRLILALAAVGGFAAIVRGLI